MHPPILGRWGPSFVSSHGSMWIDRKAPPRPYPIAGPMIDAAWNTLIDVNRDPLGVDSVIDVRCANSEWRCTPNTNYNVRHNEQSVYYSGYTLMRN